MLEDHVILRGNEAWLVNEDNRELLAGPFEAIYYEDFDYVDDDWRPGIVRYEDYTDILIIPKISQMLIIQ